MHFFFDYFFDCLSTAVPYCPNETAHRPDAPSRIVQHLLPTQHAVLCLASYPAAPAVAAAAFTAHIDFCGRALRELLFSMLRLSPAAPAASIPSMRQRLQQYTPHPHGPQKHAEQMQHDKHMGACTALMCMLSAANHSQSGWCALVL
jgi:hypothetical protein